MENSPFMHSEIRPGNKPTCRHINCDQFPRTEYSSNGARSKHEKKRAGHCIDSKHCKPCQDFKKSRTGKIVDLSFNIYECGHTNCQKRFTYLQNCNRHQKKVHPPCMETCNLCIQLENEYKKQEERKRLKKEREDALERLCQNIKDLKKMVLIDAEGDQKEWQNEIKKRISHELFEDHERDLLNQLLSSSPSSLSLSSPSPSSLPLSSPSPSPSPSSSPSPSPSPLQGANAWRAPSNSVLLYLKDHLFVTDSKWPTFVEKLSLGPNASLHFIRKLRSEINKKLPSINQSPGGRGHYTNIVEYLKWLISNAPPENENEPIVVKFCFDGASMTSNRKIQHEVGAFDILYDNFSLSLCKSPKTTHQWLLYVGSEERDALEEELRVSNILI